MTMKFNSLALRLFLTSTVIALFVLLLAAWLLITQFRATIEENFDERLKANLSLLIESSLEKALKRQATPASLAALPSPCRTPAGIGR